MCACRQDREMFVCEICGQDGLTEDEMKSHVLLTHVEAAVYCPFCDIEGANVDEMNYHINVAHLDCLTPSKEANTGSPKRVLSTETDKEKQGSGKRLRTMTDENHINPRSPGNERTVLCHSQTGNELGMSEERISTSVQNEQARRRAKLFLEVNSPVESVGSVDSASSCSTSGASSDMMDISQSDNENGHVATFHCPMCTWSTTSSTEIQRHVNVQHLDLLSPAPKAMTNSKRMDFQNNLIDNLSSSCHTSALYECPLCGIHTNTPSALEVHVNIKHKDILSPATPMDGLQVPGVSSGVAAPEPGESEEAMCPVCGMECQNMTSLTSHVEGHFSADQTPVTEMTDNMLSQDLERRDIAAKKFQEQKEFEKLQAQYGMDGKNSYKKQSQKNLEKAVSSGQLSITEYYNRMIETTEASVTGVDDGHSCSKGILNKLKDFYVKPVFNVSRTWLCSNVDHYGASYGDKGWGCGYRNLQMLLSSLAANSTYQQVLFNGRPLIPSIPKIQRLIEAAWQKGFDLQGSEQLGGKVVNTTKWIGATEIVATLSSLKIKCQLLDFHAPTGPDGTHPKLFEWVRDYFRSTGTDMKLPLYLQHQGHSRTIIGLEELKDGSCRLLLFDPSFTKKQMQQFYGEINANVMRILRRSIHGMKAKQYQIVAVVGILNEKEYQEHKIMKSERIP